jgi:hypothetical protein
MSRAAPGQLFAKTSATKTSAEKKRIAGYQRQQPGVLSAEAKKRG